MTVHQTPGDLHPSQPVRTGGEVAKHTPGPWVAEKREGDEWWFGGGDGAEIVIRHPAHKYDAVCVIGAQMSVEGPADADARLIAAAPELLEALRAVMEYAGIIEERCDSVATDKARAAIAKATGGAA